jgi:ABC-type transport system involved in cytochrome c biogenesis permease subunit
MVLGLGLQLLLVAVRWVASDHLPVTGLFESLHFLALWVVGLTLSFRLRHGSREVVPGGLLLALAAMGGASLGRKEIFPLTPALDTPLFFIHVATSFAAYGLFGLAAVLSLQRLAGREAVIPGLRRMLDEALYLGYILFTWTMLAGSLWAYLSWGSYWTWTTKGLWSYLVWFFYSGVIHVRNRRGWEGRPLDALAVLGFLLVLFTYLGLGLLLTTSHPLA